MIPGDKRIRALNSLEELISKKKATVKQIQSLAWLLNFLNHAIVPGCAFTRQMYAKFTSLVDLGSMNKFGRQQMSTELKPFHHIKLDREFKLDCEMWRLFLLNSIRGINRPFVDFSTGTNARVLDFYMDAAKGKSLGIGGIFRENWYLAQWEPGYIERCDPSIKYLELLGICVAYFAWGHLLKNQRIVLFCDYQAVMTMINTTSKCQNCMILIRMLILRSLWNNTRIFC